MASPTISKDVRAARRRSLEDMAAGLAHDFNNMLMIILGNADLALMDIDSSSPAREVVEEVHAAGKRAAERCRLLNSYASDVHLGRQESDLNELISEIGLPEGTGRSVELKRSPAPDLPLIAMDLRRIADVLNAMVGNATDALAGSEGTIEISTASVQLDGETTQPDYSFGDALPAGPCVTVTVADTGCGMTPDQVDRMFDPYFTAARVKRRGLGLTLIPGIVEAHGGRIHVESQPHQGARITITLPVQSA